MRGNRRNVWNMGRFSGGNVRSRATGNLTQATGMSRRRFLGTAAAGVGAAALGLGGAARAADNTKNLENESFWKKGRVIDVYPTNVSNPDPDLPSADAINIQELLDDAMDRDTFYFHPGTYDFGSTYDYSDPTYAEDLTMGTFLDGPKKSINIGKPGISIRITGDPNSKPVIVNGLLPFRVVNGQVLIENLHLNGARGPAIEILKSNGSIVRNCLIENVLPASGWYYTSSLGWYESYGMGIEILAIIQSIIDAPDYDFYKADFSTVNLTGTFKVKGNQFINTGVGTGVGDCLAPIEFEFLNNEIIGGVGLLFVGNMNENSHLEATGNIMKFCIPIVIGTHQFLDLNENLAKFTIKNNILGIQGAPSFVLGFMCISPNASGNFSNNKINITGSDANAIVALTNGSSFSSNRIEGDSGLGIFVGGDDNIFSGNDLSQNQASFAQVMIDLNYNSFTNNDYGPAGFAGMYIFGSNNTSNNDNFLGNFPGWSYGNGCIFLDFGSAYNKITALKNGLALQGFALCNQRLDLNYEFFGQTTNVVPGLIKCDKKDPDFVQDMQAKAFELTNKIKQMRLDKWGSLYPPGHQ